MIEFAYPSTGDYCSNETSQCLCLEMFYCTIYTLVVYGLMNIVGFVRLCYTNKETHILGI